MGDRTYHASLRRCKQQAVQAEGAIRNSMSGGGMEPLGPQIVVTRLGQAGIVWSANLVMMYFDSDSAGLGNLYLVKKNCNT